MDIKPIFRKLILQSGRLTLYHKSLPYEIINALKDGYTKLDIFDVILNKQYRITLKI